MTSIDPAELAAQITRCDEHQGVCLEHRNTEWPCSYLIEATERIRAASKKVWIEGYTAAAKQHPDVAFIGARCPYTRSKGDVIQ